MSDYLDDLNEPPTAELKNKSAQDYLNDWCTPEADEMVATLTLGLGKDERDVYMSGGRRRGPHQLRNYSNRPPVLITRETPHCHGLLLFLATRELGYEPLPAVVAVFAT